MAISRGKRNRGRTKVEDKERKRLLSLQPAMSKRRKKRKKGRTSTEDSAGSARIKGRNRNTKRNKLVQRAKREHKKQLKLAKKARAKSKVQARSTTPSSSTSVTTPRTVPEPVPEVQPETEDDIPLLEDVIYSTFDSLLEELGEITDTIKSTVIRAINEVGKEEAMIRLEKYMNDTKDKSNIFNLPLKYKEFCKVLISEFASTMYGRALTIAETEEINTAVDNVWFDYAIF